MSQIEVDKVIPQSGTALQVGESGDTITIPAGATITNNGTATGFDTDTNDKVKVSANDTTAGFLNGKLVAGTNISLTEGSDGGNETLTAALTGTIATAQIADDAITLAKMAPGTDGNIISYDASGNPVAVATGSSGQVLTSAGAGAPPTFSALPVGGITVADTWRITANKTDRSDITANWERDDTYNPGQIGSAMTESSGIFTFPSTGVYQIDFWTYLKNTEFTSYAGIYISATTNNSSYNIASEFVTSIAAANYYGGGYSSYLFDVTNTSNCKVKFTTAGANDNTIYFGNTNINYTAAQFKRLGDT